MSRSHSDNSALSTSTSSTTSSGSMYVTDPRPTPSSRYSHHAGAMSPTMSAGGVGGGTFTMGFRKDCEKCVRKVEGHYAHYGASNSSSRAEEGERESDGMAMDI